jgi:alcohol dehydrogenase (cytochrome c)
MSHRLLAASACSLSLLFCASSAAQSLADLRNDAATSADVTTYGMGWSQQRYSALAKIDKANVKRLVPAWNLSLDHSANASTQPLLVNGVMYVTTHNATTAIDAETGRQKWKTAIELPADVNGYLCCGIQSRGAAALDGVLYRTTIDAHVMAIDMATGKTLWKKQAADYKQGYSMTHAPLVAGGVLITGISGGEYGTRGFLDGWDLKTGEKKWRTWTVPAPGEKGSETWNADRHDKGGAPTWLTGTYDPELNLVYWGTGNGGPWNPAWRGKDSLYICSILALDPATGKVAWYYQTSPGDPYDYDATNELVLGDLPVDGANRKVLMQANRNGFFYVLDRTNGKLLSANQFGKKINWATGVDMKTGRPIDTPMTASIRANVESKDFIEAWPSAFGAKNWMPMSFDPAKKRVFMNTLNIGMKVKYNTPAYKQGAWYLGLDLGGWAEPEDGMRGALTAWDPVAGKKLWEVPTATPYWAGVLSTAGGLVFTGAQTGEFLAFDADTGAKLWQFQTGSGISSLPITWERNGQQYVTVVSGGATLYGMLGGDAKLAQVPAGSSVWTFKLIE